MMTAEAVKALIESGLEGARATVSGEDGVHFEAAVVCPAFEGLSMVRQHQMVYAALGARMGREIHALSLQTYTPAQWEASGDLRVL